MTETIHHVSFHKFDRCNNVLEIYSSDFVWNSNFKIVSFIVLCGLGVEELIRFSFSVFRQFIC